MKSFSAPLPAMAARLPVRLAAVVLAASTAAAAPASAPGVGGAAATVPLATMAPQLDRAVLDSTPRPPVAQHSAVVSGDTLYVSGQLDLDEHGRPGKTPQESAKLALDHVKKVIEGAGFSMNDLVLVQVFSTDSKAFGDFNKVYRTYFSGPMPARAFMGAGSLIQGGRFEVLGIAVKGHK